jgi:methylthioribose-1-phosphate isomerase
MKINGTSYRTIWPDRDTPGAVNIIDQRLLPFEFIIEKLTEVDQVVRAIKDMYVRGAGLIGATAGFGMHIAAATAPHTNFMDFLEEAGEKLSNSRPTARNLQWAVDRVLEDVQQAGTRAEKKNVAFETACKIAEEDAEFCRRLGQHGVEILANISKKKNGKPVNILTHCNAGWLAFVDYGSATAPIYAARDAGIDIHVWVDETRPWNQGSRLTAWELQQEGIANTLITDNCGGHLMQNGMVDLVLVGTDRTTRTGDVANKIGTYLKALAAFDNNIPFFVTLPSSTFDWDLDNGHNIPIEIREGNEIMEISGIDANGHKQTVALTAPNTKAANFSFDVTPARLVTGLITERGIVAAKEQAIAEMYPEHTGKRGQA